MRHRLARMAGPRLTHWTRRTRFARSGNTEIAYEIRGRWRRKRPWVVLIQGLGYDRAGWQPVLRGLGRRFRLVLIDNRGSGASSPSRVSFSVGDMARVIATVLDAARIGPAHVIGVSLGGMVAQELAIEHPEHVDRLVLVATTPGWPTGYPMPAKSVALITASARMPAEVAARAHVENALAPDTVRQRPDLVERLVDHRRSHPTGRQAWLAQMQAGASYAGNLRQSRIRSPTLVLHGDADRVVDPRNAELLAARIPNARLQILPGLGHLFFWEDAQGFVDAVVEFLLPDGGAR
jgi:pimeloyl-ACP methyl ester carboxylesterase